MNGKYSRKKEHGVQTSVCSLKFRHNRKNKLKPESTDKFFEKDER
jgi:hypothetical protein